jgi:hypothetical protein
MKIEDVEKSINLLHEYSYIDSILERAKEVQYDVTILLDKIKNTVIDAEQFQYRKDITDKIQKLISYSYRDGHIFEQDVLMFGIEKAITKLEYKLKSLKNKIEEL